MLVRSYCGRSSIVQQDLHQTVVSTGSRKEKERLHITRSLDRDKFVQRIYVQFNLMYIAIYGRDLLPEVCLPIAPYCVSFATTL